MNPSEKYTMGLFSTLTSSDEGRQTSSMNVPTLVQLYASKPIALDTTSKVTGYTAMTYQAIQSGLVSDDQELKNRHQNPDLGVWDCRVGKGKDENNKQVPLLDSLLAKVASHVRTFCWTVDMSDSATVEPTISLLQAALVRHLIENPPPAEETRQTSTTSLYQLQATQFGLATDDKESNIIEKNISESSQAVKTCIIICAILPEEKEEISESAYKTKQANALVIYHLRRFAAAINASLCFVEPEEKSAAAANQSAGTTSSSSSPMKESQKQTQRSSASEASQPAVSPDELSILWKDLAMDKEIWKTSTSNVPTNSSSSGSSSSNEEETNIANIAAPLYGPGGHQEEFIESVLLRNAHYPGHWEASKDSLWVALPTPSENKAVDEGPVTGDEGWLSQLRESIASAAEAPKAAVVQEETKTEEKTAEPDVAVSDFFASLLKDP